ncbi:MAG TPA: hypothetical protein VKI01_01810 [Acidimicrobiia bacterium]|nr:hypothetical protein [Acidimicrobiia bacterium]
MREWWCEQDIHRLLSFDFYAPGDAAARTRRSRSPGSLEAGYDLHSSVEVVDKDLAGRILAGNVRGVFDRVIEVREPHEVCSPSPIPPAVDLLDDSKELRHAP